MLFQRSPNPGQVRRGRRWRGAVRALVAVAGLGALSGCGLVDNAAQTAANNAAPLAVVSAVSLINTDKTIIDHIAGGVRGEDCSTLRAMDGGHYCQARYENVPVVPSVYCYRTLAAVTCYDRPSTNASDTLVGVRPGGQLPTY